MMLIMPPARPVRCLTIITPVQNSMHHQFITDACPRSLPPQTEDLSRMYRLFHRIPNGLNPVADTFRKHVEDEGNKLVNETAEAIEAKKDKDRNKKDRKNQTRRAATNSF